MGTWTREYIDGILDLGDALYLKSIQDPGGSCLIEIPPEKIHHSFFFKKDKISFEIDSKRKLVEFINFAAENTAKEALQEVLEKFFKQCASGIVTSNNKHMSVWIQDDAYYLFDPTEHQNDGGKWKGIPGSGFSVLYRSKTIRDLIDNIFMNLTSKLPNTKIEFICCTILRIIKLKTDPPATLEEILPDGGTPSTAEERPVTAVSEMKAVDVHGKPLGAEEKVLDLHEMKLRKYIQESKADDSSVKIKLEELPPDFNGAVFTKKPSWFKDGMDKMDVCKFPIPFKALWEKVTFYTDIIPEKIGIIRASTCQTDPKFSKYLGRQSMGNAISALIMLRFYKSRFWVPKVLNTILKYGDLLYRDAMITIPRTQSLKLSNFQRKTEYEERKFSPIIDDYVVVGKLQSQEYEVLDLLPALEKFLTDNENCVILGPITLAVWVEDGKFFTFDPNERDKEGRAINEHIINGTSPGKACAMWFTSIQDLVDLYMNNVEKSKRSDTFYLSKVQIKDYVDIPDTWYNFKGILPNMWILRGTFSQSDKKYGKQSRNLQSPANCLVVLALKELQPLKEWSDNTVDETIRSYCKQLPKQIPNPQTQNLIIQPQDINTNSVTPAFETDNNIQPQYIKSQAQRDHPKHQPLVKYQHKRRQSRFPKFERSMPQSTL
ncbi:hypothetical protein JTB14_031714 [Gonioctena quinquepunctata]|nr:hypothetical protein JTB14_031714 [Gonioctena quinquepunctata]